MDSDRKFVIVMRPGGAIIAVMQMTEEEVAELKMDIDKCQARIKDTEKDSHYYSDTYRLSLKHGIREEKAKEEKELSELAERRAKKVLSELISILEKKSINYERICVVE